MCDSGIQIFFLRKSTLVYLLVYPMLTILFSLAVLWYCAVQVTGWMSV